METADPRVLERIRGLSRDDQERIVLELTRYAAVMVGIKAWWLPGRILPDGYESADLAYEALSLVLVGRRRWDPDVQPDFLAYLRSVVDSLLSHLLDSEGRKRAVRFSPDSDDDEDPLDAIPASGPAPDEQIVLAEEARADAEVYDAMLEALKDEEEQLVFLELAEGKKPAQIAESLGISVQRVYQVKRNILRRLSAIADRTEVGEKEVKNAPRTK